MDADSASCAVKRAMIDRAGRTLLVADSSKYDVAQFERVCALSDVDDLVSEAAPPKHLAVALKRAGARVLIAR
jgi:DeoR family glycerol-3-phosphate regulon repressor